MRKQLLARKSVEQLHLELEGADRLHRVLGRWSLTGMGIGAIIGAGIFVLTGLAAHDYAGPSLMLSFVLAATGCALAGLCYAEFAAMIPVAGSAYTYAYATLGELFAWIIGWDLVLEYAIASCAVAHGWSHYFQALLALYGFALPGWLSIDPFSASPEILAAAPQLAGIPIVFDAAALAIALLLTVVLVVGIRESAGLNALIVALKLGVVLFVIVAGIPHVDPGNWTPFFPFGIFGTFAGASYVFFAYIGFDSISTQAEEARHPDRDVPFAILMSLGVCTFLYIAVAAVLTGMIPYDQIDINAPIVAAFSSKGLGVASMIIAIGAVAGITSVLLVMMLSQARVLLAMARDGLLPPRIFATIHPKYRTPWISQILIGLVVGVIAAVLPLEALAELVNIGTLFAFVIVCAAVLVMRRTRPDVHRPFRTPLVPFVPIAGIIANLILMLALGWQNWLRLAVWMAGGMLIYWFYGRRHSHFYEPTARN